MKIIVNTQKRVGDIVFFFYLHAIYCSESDGKAILEKIPENICFYVKCSHICNMYEQISV